MQLTLQSLSPNQLWDALYGISGKRSTTIDHLPSEKSGFSKFFAKNSPAKQFYASKISAPVKYDVANAGKQLSHGEVFEENERQS